MVESSSTDYSAHEPVLTEKIPVINVIIQSIDLIDSMAVGKVSTDMMLCPHTSISGKIPTFQVE